MSTYKSIAKELINKVKSDVTTKAVPATKTSITFSRILASNALAFIAIKVAPKQ